MKNPSSHYKPRHVCSDAEKISAVKRMFREITPRYDLLNRILSARSDVQWRKRAARSVPQNAARVLDVAAGSGDLTIEIARQRPEVNVTGVDFVPEMLERALDKTKTAGLHTRIQYVLGDAMSLPFKDNTFDAAGIAFGLRNIPDRLGAIREMARVVRPGGKVITLEMTFPRNLKLRSFFQWYLKHIIPRLGGLISQNAEAYSYLSQSIHEFLYPDELTRLFAEAGLESLKASPLTLGICWLHEGISPSQSSY